MKKRLRKFIRRQKDVEATYSDVPGGEGVPRITNETVAAHREEVIGSARKYIYPLQHSKHKIVIISTALFIAAIIGFFSYFTVALYKLKSNSTFLYRVTQVIPFPIAKVGGKFVAYENYLFELRHYVHYYENQLKLNFNDPNNKEQLVQFKKRALDKVVNDAYVKELAATNNISVSSKEINDQIVIARDQNRLGNNDKVFEDVLRDYWGWSLNDFKRELKSELLAQKVISTLDTATHSRADAALSALQSGESFAKVAKKYSDDKSTKNSGGDYGYPIDQTTRNLSPLTTTTLFGLKTDQYSLIINTGTSLEIIKKIDVNGHKVRAAHIQLNFQPIETYINTLKEKEKTRTFIRV